MSEPLEIHSIIISDIFHLLDNGAPLGMRVGFRGRVLSKYYFNLMAIQRNSGQNLGYKKGITLRFIN